MSEYTPDKPDGSGESTVEYRDDEGTSRAIPYHYEHVPRESEWEVVALIPYSGGTPVHQNTYRVPGDCVAGFLVEMNDDAHAEMVVSVRRLT